MRSITGVLEEILFVGQGRCVAAVRYEAPGGLVAATLRSLDAGLRALRPGDRFTATGAFAPAVLGGWEDAAFWADTVAARPPVPHPAAPWAQALLARIPGAAAL